MRKRETGKWYKKKKQEALSQLANEAPTRSRAETRYTRKKAKICV